MGEAKRRRDEAIVGAAEEITRQLARTGKLVEGGFQSLRTVAMHKDAPPDQIREMRMAFYAGSQHIFSSLMVLVDPGHEVTDADMMMMEGIQKELDDFLTEFSARHLPTQGNG